MSFNETNLPKTFLKPPFPAPHENAEPNWARDWSAYYICEHWDGSKWGMLAVVSDWVARIEKREPLSRQRIDQMRKNVLWLVRHRMTWKPETREIIERYTPQTAA